MHKRRHQGKVTTPQIIRPSDVAVRPLPLVTRPRPPAWAVAAVFVLLALALLLFFQVRGLIGQMESRQVEAPADSRLRALGQQMEVLRGRFNGLLAESIETRLRLLQKNVDAGKASTDDLRTFADLQRDLALLEAYAEQGAAVPAGEVFEHARYQPLAAIPPPRGFRNEDLLDEVRQLKFLLYFSATVLAVICCVAALVGLRRRKLRALPFQGRQLPDLEFPKEGN